jgi:hypothetical protein
MKECGSANLIGGWKERGSLGFKFESTKLAERCSVNRELLFFIQNRRDKW